MASSKLLKEAIADAKAVRETALANAKIQLEEAFTPRLKSMLSQKLRAEAEDMESEEDEMKEVYGEDDEKEEDKMEEDYNSSNIGAGTGGTTSGQNNKKPTEHNAGAEDKLGAADVTSTSKKPEAEVEDYTFEKSITEESGEEEDLASGDVKFATEGDEMSDDEMSPNTAMDNEAEYGDEDQSEDDLDLEQIIKELEQELHYGDNEMEDESEEDNIDSDEFEKMGEEADDVDTAMDAEDPHAVMAKEGEENDEEEMNIEEIIKELEEEEKAEEDKKEKVEESNRLKKELAEAISVIKSLKSTINEVRAKI